ncbi:MAG: ATP-binding protein [Gammaproteobacteria bacterium]|nr:ATP-binding protein [Gammaproteobacteria bacterium]
MNGIIFIGLQASGKSTFFLEKFYTTHLRLNMDMLKTRNRELILLNACIDAKQSVVIDNTNPTVKERKNYINTFKKGKFNIVGYYFQSKIDECIQRNSKRQGKEKIPEIGIKGTFNKLEIPTFKEGFDELYYVSLEDNMFSVKEWKDEI